MEGWDGSFITLCLFMFSFVFIIIACAIKNKMFLPLTYTTFGRCCEPDEQNLEDIFQNKGGCFNFNVPLAQYTRLRVGGPAQIFFRPADVSNLISTLKRKPPNLPVTVIGMGSNLLVRDGGVPGIVVHLTKGFQDFKVLDNSFQVEVGAGLPQQLFSKLCARAGIGGLEFLCGIPGSIGGALRMNAGAHGIEVKDRLISACVVDPKGGFHCLNVSELNYSYRHCELPKDWIFVSAIFQGEEKSTEEILKKMEFMTKYREEVQPLKERTAGFTFVNSDNRIPVWKLIRDAGCEGLRKGGAKVSTKHCNFLVNFNSASAEDLELLGESVQANVYKKSGVLLRWEIHRIGVNETIRNKLN